METIFGSNVTVEELAKRIGLPLSVVIGPLAIAVIWWNWEQVKKRPGFARTLAYLREKLFPASDAKKGDLLIDTLVSLDGSCDFRIDGKQLECENKLAYMTFKNKRVQVNACPKLLGAVAFSGGKDLQPQPEHYLLTVDRLTLSGGTVVPANGVCFIKMRADGQRVYMVECSALAHDGRTFEFKFTPDSSQP